MGNMWPEEKQKNKGKGKGKCGHNKKTLTKEKKIKSFLFEKGGRVGWR